MTSLKEKKSYPGVEYQYVPKFFRHPITVLRMSLADFDFSESVYLPPFESNIFWLTWILVVLITCIVFLNFIIAEVTTSYQTVNDHIQGLVEKERAVLIEEAEDMMIMRMKQDKKFFPKYLVTREIE